MDLLWGFLVAVSFILLGLVASIGVTKLVLRLEGWTDAEPELLTVEEWEALQEQEERDEQRERGGAG